MTKLTTLIRIAAMAAAVVAAGCKSAAKPADDGASAPAAAPQPEPKRVAHRDEPVAAPTGELPAACATYRAEVAKLATCDKLPKRTRDTLRLSYERTSAAWANMPADTNGALAAACERAADTVRLAVAAACGG